MSVIKALEAIDEMNEIGKSKVPDNAPLDFISNRWNIPLLDKLSLNKHGTQE